MTFTFWEPIPPQTALFSLDGTSVMFFGKDPLNAVVATFHDQNEEVTMRFARTTDLDLAGILTYGISTPLSTVSIRFFPPSEGKMVAIPPVVWQHRATGIRGRTPAVLAAASASLVAMLSVNTALAGAVALPVAAMVGAALWFVLRKTEPTHINTPGGLDLRGDNIVEYAQQRNAGQRPEMIRNEERRRRLSNRVANVQAEFGDLQSDIVYRIDNSALFDSAVPATERFQMALIAWEDACGVPFDELDSLAADVEITYSIARDNAETLGLFHLPETARSDGRRAAKAARLAVSSPNQGEREASRHQLMRILNSLALYWLPDVKDAAKAIEGHEAEDK